MRRALVIAPVVALVMLVAGTAFADKPTREIIPVDVTFEDASCGFTVLIHYTGTVVRDTRVKHGETTYHESYPNTQVELTNEDTGTSVTLGIPGPGTWTIHADGTTTLKGEGPWLWFENPHTGESGIFRTSGRFTQEFDANGGTLSISIVGGSTRDLCAELAA